VLTPLVRVQVHYLLGHYYEEFILERGKALEIKIDYGEAYEKVRIRNNYPRVTGKELAKLKQENLEDDPDFIEACLKASLAEITENMAFLETFVQEQAARGIVAPQSARERALFVAVLSLRRLKAIKRKSVSLNGGAVGGASREGIVTRARTLLTNLRALVSSSITQRMFNKDVFRSTLEERLKVKSGESFLQYLDLLCASDT
jgi:hypothetical protein